MKFDKKIYAVDFSKLARWLTPTMLRMPKLLAFVLALVTPVADLYSRFLVLKANLEYRLTITPQVCYMEKALNDRWDIVERRIVIVDAVEYNPIPLFLKIEDKPVVFNMKSEGGPVILYTKSETAMFTVDFIVRVPILVAFDMAEMRAVVDAYKLAGKTFKIQII